MALNNGKNGAHPAESIEGIDRISIAGFKSIARETAIDIRPLTILAGANSSGKSSIIQPLLLLKQTLEAPYDPGVFKLDGPNVNFTEARQLITRDNTQESHIINVSIGRSDVYVTSSYSYDSDKKMFDVHRVQICTDSETYEIWPGMSHEELRNALPNTKDREFYFDNMSFETIRRRSYVDIMATAKRTLKSPLSGNFSVSSANSFTTDVEQFIGTIIHIPGLRGTKDRYFPVAAVGPTFPGTFDEYFASVIHQWVTENSPQLRDLTKNLRSIGLAQEITAEKITDAHIKISVSLAKGKHTPEWTELADVGFGVSQTLPVLVALLVARPGQLVYLEDPESHLHPRAQVALAAIIAQASKRGVRVVVETHSSLLILGIQTLVAEGKLDPSLVKLHWFELRKGITHVSSADLDEAGRFGEWPEDFDDVALNAQGAYLDAVGSMNVKLRAAAH